MNKLFNIGIAERFSKSNWNEKFLESLNKKIEEGIHFSYEIINIDKSDWLEQIKPYNIIIWKSPWMGQLSNHYKEKIYFIKYFLKKETIPNLDTIWHFESKIAQHFLFKELNIKSPKTFLTFDYREAMEYINQCLYPQILKLSAGSGSNHVKMIKNKRQAKIEIKKHFTKTRTWAYLRKISDHQMFGSVYLQEFIPNNDSDLRITTIGDKYAFGFWRKNRKNDFRASGSGKIDFNRKVPEDMIKYCLDISKKLNFDSMAYDILFEDNKALITEISYGYNHEVIYNTPGYYENLSNNEINFKQGHYWPEYLWVEWLFEKFKIY